MKKRIFLTFLEENVKNIYRVNKTAMQQMWLIVFFTTTVVFLFEGMVHFNIGKASQKITLPSGKEFGYIVLTVVIFSLINSVAVWGLEKIFLEDSPPNG